MELMLAKALSALGLLLSSLCFGLIIPFFVLKSRIGYRPPPFQNEDTVSTDTTFLLNISDSATELNVSNRQWPGKCEMFKNFLHKQYSKLCTYDIISFINCFCGGLFLGVSLLQLLPESREGISNIVDMAGIQTKLPISEFLISVGLLLVMLIEQIAIAKCAHNPTEEPGDCNSSDQDLRVDNIRQISPTQSRDDSSDDQCILQEPSSTVINIIEDMPNSSSSIQAEIHEPLTSESTRSLVLIAMLSVHSIFEGLALGLESTIANLIQLLIAIVVHKSVIAFSLGMKLFETFAQHGVRIAVLCVVIFCTASPIGCTIGLFLTPTNDNSTSGVPTTQFPFSQSYNLRMNNLAEISGTMYASAILQCLATGTFIFVTFIEVIPSEFSHTDNHGVGHDVDETVSRNEKLPIRPAVKFLTLIVGFLFITGLQFI